jgi:excisionase family DNA binding protein
MPAKLLTAPEVAALLGVSVRHIRRLVASRQIPFVRCGTLLRFEPDQIDQWLCTQRVGMRRAPS